MNLSEPKITGYDDSGPSKWTWVLGGFEISVRMNAIDIDYDFEGRMGPVTLSCWDPEMARTLATALTAAADKAEALRPK